MELVRFSWSRRRRSETCPALTEAVFLPKLSLSKPASGRGGFWRVIGSFSPVPASPTFGRLAPFSPPLAAQNGPSGLSFSVSFGLLPIRPLVENPVFMRVFRPSIFSGFDSDTLTTRRFELPSEGYPVDDSGVMRCDTADPLALSFSRLAVSLSDDEELPGAFTLCSMDDRLADVVLDLR